MNIIHITAGAGGMYCGGCFRDNALVASMRRKGHPTLMIPVYLPFTLEETDQSEGTPIFFGGISVYLEQKIPWFGMAPRWMHRMLASPALLKWASGKAAKTRAEDLGALTLSMLQGEEGRQAVELEALLEWLETQNPPDLVCLSTALLAGMGRRMKERFKVPVVGTFQGEDSFLDTLPTSYRERSWQTLAERCQDLDAMIAPSYFYGDLMKRRLQLREGQVKVIWNGINLEGYQSSRLPQDPPVLGYFARMCRDKGLDIAVEAWLLLKKRPGLEKLRLHIGGGLGPSDEPFVGSLKTKIEQKGFQQDVAFFPNVDRVGKLNFFQSLTCFTVPARYGEAFGLYVIEALGSGVPVVQPRDAAFPEVVDATGGGLLCEKENPASLADAVERLLKDRPFLLKCARDGRAAIHSKFNADHSTDQYIELYQSLRKI